MCFSHPHLPLMTKKPSSSSSHLCIKILQYKEQKMSWQPYVDDHLMSEIEGHRLTAAAIIGHDGNVWAKSDMFPEVYIFFFSFLFFFPLPISIGFLEDRVCHDNGNDGRFMIIILTVSFAVCSIWLKFCMQWFCLIDLTCSKSCSWIFAVLSILWSGYCWSLIG